MPANKSIGYKQGTAAERAALNVQRIELGQIWFETDSVTFYEVVSIVPGVHVWQVIGGPGSLVPVTQSFTGAGPYVINDGTDAAFGDPLTLAATVVLPPSPAAGDSLTITQTGEGSITLPSTVFAETSSYTLSQFNDSVTLLFDGTAWRLQSYLGSPLTFSAWVSSTGSDSAVGTLADPLLTIDEAIARLSTVGSRTTAQVHVLGTTLALPNISIPGSGGVAAGLMEIIGDTAVATTGSVTSFSVQTAQTPLFITNLGAGWVADEHRGSVIKFISGPLNGTEIGIFDNTTDTLTVMTFDTPAVAPGIGDMFEIIRNVTTLSGAPQINPGSGFRIKFNRVNLGGFMIAQECYIEFERVLFSLFGAFFEQNCDVFMGVNAYGAIFTGPFAAVVNVGSLKAYRMGLHNISLQVFKDNASVVQAIADGRSRFNVMSTANLQNIYSPNSILSSGTNFVQSEGAYVSLKNASISNVAGDSAISAINGRITMEGVIGTGNFSPCVDAATGSSIFVKDPGVGTTITAGGADVKVGANAPVTWGAIATGLAVSTTDLANVSSQICRVGA